MTNSGFLFMIRTNHGATTLCILTLSTMTLSIMTFSITTPSIGSFHGTLRISDSITTLNITMVYYYAECHYAECRILFTIFLNVGMLSVVAPKPLLGPLL
jgi:hypothetical protein